MSADLLSDWHFAINLFSCLSNAGDSPFQFHDSPGSHFDLDFRLKCVTGRNDSPPFMTPGGVISAKAEI